jgi:hypothetical protein
MSPNDLASTAAALDKLEDFTHLSAADKAAAIGEMSASARVRFILNLPAEARVAAQRGMSPEALEETHCFVAA